MRRNAAVRRADKASQVRLAGQRRRDRRGLLATTALQAGAVLVLALPAQAQLAPTARPTGGQVVAGQAAISQTAAQTNVAQTSQRAVVDWRSFDIGSAHAVVYAQPNASSIILNRVTGPNPSEIAGRISANGQVVIVNGSGVVFQAGSQVDVQTLVVSAANVTNQHFMAGQMVFDQPGQPNAKISNAGTITVKATGLAALVAPQVSNSGTITAKLGHVVLAGAEAHTIDLYGDGLMSVDVTREVRTTPAGATALVTNTGMIMADGGTIVLTAKAADGIVQNLVSAKGRLQANSVADKAGTIVVSGIGGSVTIEGTIDTDGHGPAGHGGTVMLAATNTVALKGGARVTANGAAGGGTVAIGTTPARAQAQGTAAGSGIPAGSARLVTVAKGAKIAADGKNTGSGGTVAVISTSGTSMAGTMTARGGAKGGDGGRVEISSTTNLSITGTVDTTAPAGHTGTLLIDPDELDIGDNVTTANPANPTANGSNAPATGTQTISATDFNTLAASNDITLAATTTINLAGATALGNTAHSITLNGGTTATININEALSALTLSLTGASIAQTAAGIVTATTLTGSTMGAANLGTAVNAITNLGAFTAGGTFTLNNGTNALNISGAVNATGQTLSLAAGSLSQTAAGIVTAGTLTGSTSGLANLGTATNAVTNLGAFTNTSGTFTLNNGTNALNISGAVNATGNILSLTAGSLSQTAAGIVTAGTLTGSTGGLANLGTATNAVTNLGAFTNTSGTFTLNNGTNGLNITGAVNATGNILSLTAGSLSQTAAGIVTAGTLTGSTSGVANLGTATNAVTNLGAFTNTSGDFTLNNGTNGLNITGAVNATGNILSLTAGSLSQTAAGIVTAGTLTGSTSGVANLGTATNAVTNLGAFTNTSGTFTLNNGTNGLNITGAVNATGNILRLTAGSLSQTAAGIVTAGTLTGSTSGVANLGTATNAVTNLGAFTNTSGDFTLNNGTNGLNISGAVNVTGHTLSLTAGSLSQAAAGVITAGTLTGSVGDASAATTGHDATLTADNLITGLGNLTASQGDFTLSNAHALTVTGGVTARNVTLTTTGAGSTLTVDGSVGACAIDAATAGTVTLTSAEALTLAGTVGGERSTALSGTAVNVEAGAFVEAGRSGASPLSGTVTVTAPLTISGGVLSADTVTVNGSTTQTGGTLYAPSFSTTGAVQFSNGSLFTTGDLTIAVPTGDALGGTVSTNGALSVSGANIASSAKLFALGNITITEGGNFNQTGGQIAAGGTLTIAGSTGASPGTIQQTAGTMAAATRIELYGDGAGTASLAGTLAAPLVQIIERNADVTFQPATLTNAATITDPSYAVSYHCPGCDGLSPSLTLTPGIVALPATAPDTVRLDGNTLQLNATFATGTLELHSAGATTQAAAFTAGTLFGTAGYTASIAAGLPLYDVPTTGTASATLGLANGVTTLGPYYTAGGLTVRSTSAMTVADLLVAGGNQAIALTAPSLTIDHALQFGTLSGGFFASDTRPTTPDSGTFTQSTLPASSISFSQVTLQADTMAIGAAVSPLGGIVSIAPLSTTRALTVDASRSTGSLSLTQADFDNLHTLGTAADVGTAGPQTVRLGSLDGSTQTASNVQFNAPLALTNIAATLGLYAQDAVTEIGANGISIGRQAGALPEETGTITGAAGGTIQLGSLTDTLSANHFDVLGPLTAGAGLTVSDSPDANSGLSGLLVSGSVTSGTGDLGLLSAGSATHVGGTIAIAGTLDATGQTLTLEALNGAQGTAAITTTAGSTIKATTLTGFARTTDTFGAPAYDVLLDASTTNQTLKLGAFTVGTTTSGVVSAQGAFKLKTATDLEVDGTVTAKSVALTANNITVAGNIGACDIGTGTGDVTLTSLGTITVTSGIIGGQRSLTLAADGGTAMSGGTLNAPAVTFDATTGGQPALTLTGGTVFGNTVTVDGDTTQSGGALYANHLDATGTYKFSAGTLAIGDSTNASGILAITVPGTTLAGSISTGGKLTVDGTNIHSSGTLYAGADLDITDAGSFLQTAGTITAGQNLTVATTLAGGGVVNQSGGLMQAVGTLELYGYGGGAVSIAGQLAGATVDVVETAANLDFRPTLNGTATLAAGTPLVFGFDCPGCTSLSTGVTLPVSVPSPGIHRTPSLRVDGLTIALGSDIAADRVVLHSIQSTTQPGGSLTASVLSGTAGYAVNTTLPNNPSTLPVYDLTAGTSGATVTLDRSANNLAQIDGYQVRGNDTTQAGLVVVDAPATQIDSTGASLAPNGLLLTGTVRAGPASNTLNVTTEAASGNNVTLTVNGTVNGIPQGLQIGDATHSGTVLAGNVVQLTAAGSIIEGTGGSTIGQIVAATLTGLAGGSATLASNANQIGTLAPFTATARNFTLVDSRNLQVTGRVSASAGTVAITAQDGSGTASASEPTRSGERPFATGDLTIQPPSDGGSATITGNSVQLTGTDVIISGLVGACTVGAAGGDVTVTATGTPSTSTIGTTAPGSITVNTGAVVGGQASLTMAAAGGTTVAGGTLDAPAVTFSTTGSNPALTLGSGTVFGNTVTVNGDTQQTGGSLYANTFSTTGTTRFSGGTLATGNNLAIAVLANALAGTVSTGGTLTATGTNITSSGTLYAGGNLAITDTGTFQQTGGTIAAANNLTVTATAGVVDQSGGVMAAGNTLLLRGFGGSAASVTGQLAAATIEVVEPGAPLSFAPSVFTSGNHPLGGAATVLIGTLTNSFICPGCTPVGTGPTLTASTATPGSNRPADLRLDGATLSLGSGALVLAADTIELHSLGTTVQAGGTLEASVLTGTAGYAGSTAPLPVYTLGAGTSGATVTLDQSGNNLARIDGYQVRGNDTTRVGLIVVDRPASQTDSTGASLTPNGLLLTGTVQAGPANGTLTGSAEAQGGNDIALTVTGGGLQIGDATHTGTVLAGNLVQLNAAGDIAEGTAGATTIGQVVAATLNATAGGSVLLGTATTATSGNGGNQIATLGTVSASTGSVLVQNSRNLTVAGPVTAQTGITITAQSGAGTASAAEGAASGNLVLAGTLSTVAGNAALTAYGSLTGASVSAPGQVSLTAGQDVNVTGIAAGVLTGAAGGAFTATGAFPVATSLAAVSGSLTLTDTAALSLTGTSSAAGSALISAPSISTAGDLYAGATVRLRATNGSFVQNSGTIAAGTSLLITGQSDTLPVSGSVTQVAGLLAAGGNLRILATGDATQDDAGAIAAPVVEVASLTGANTFGASQSAQVTAPATTVSLAGVLPSFTLPAGTVALSARPQSVQLDGATVTLTRLVAADTVQLQAAGNVSETGNGTLTAATLLGSAGFAAGGTDAGTGLPVFTTLDSTGTGQFTLTAAGNNILRLGNIFARSGLTLVDGPATQVTAPITTQSNVAGTTLPGTGLTIGGTVRAGVATDPLTGDAVDASGAPLSITLTGASPALTLGDAAAPGATLAGSLVTLVTPGTLSEAPGALIAAGTLFGSANTASLPGANQVVRLGTFTTSGDFALTNSRSLQVSGATKTGSSTAIALTVTGALDLNGGSLATGAATLSTTGNLTETNGFIAASTLALTAAQANANAAQNQIATLASVTAPGGFSLATAMSLTSTGSINASNGPISLMIGGNLTLQSSSTVTSGTSVMLTAGGQATLAGTIATPLAIVRAPSIALQGGTISVAGAPQTSTTPAARLATVATASKGLFLETASLSQTGTTAILPLAGSAFATMRVDLTNGLGNVTFANLSAPATNLILGLGDGGVAGQVDVGSLTVLYTGSGLGNAAGSAELQGTVNGLTGTAAAGVSQIFQQQGADQFTAQQSRDYRLNACAVASVNCIILQPQAVPIGNPLKELVLNFFRQQEDDEDLLLPNVTDQGL